MKKFDRYSIRGIIFSTVALSGIAYEIFSSRPNELFVIILYGFIFVLGLLLLFVIKEPK